MIRSRVFATIIVASVAGALAACSPGVTANPAQSGTQVVVPSPIPPHARPVVITHGPRTSDEVALTIDADFSPFALDRVNDGRYPEQVNHEVMKLLRTTPATVFVTGMWAQQYPTQLAELARNPRIELANHSWDHDAWTSDCYSLPSVTSDAAKRLEITKTNAIVKKQTGIEMFYFRFPGMCHRESDVELVTSLGMQAVDTDIDVDDAFAHNGQATAKEMLAATKPGSILLMHLNGSPNVPATGTILRDVIAGLHDRGLHPVTLRALLQR